MELVKSGKYVLGFNQCRIAITFSLKASDTSNSDILLLIKTELLKYKHEIISYTINKDSYRTKNGYLYVDVFVLCSVENVHFILYDLRPYIDLDTYASLEISNKYINKSVHDFVLEEIENLKELYGYNEIEIKNITIIDNNTVNQKFFRIDDLENNINKQKYEIEVKVTIEGK